MFTEGDRVRDRLDPPVVGVVVGQRAINGRVYVSLRLDTGLCVNVLEGRLEPVLDKPDALADLAAARLSAPDNLRRLLTHVRLTGRLSDVFYSMEASDTDFHAYQFKPVLKILNSISKGLLIADEVGLGKTIEAGLVWLELMARYNAGRLLVICPKSLQEKWKLELLRRFSVQARICKAEDLTDALRDAQRLQSDFALITSYSAVRAPAGWDSDDEMTAGSRAELARFLRDNEGDEPLVDLVVFDEAHHLRNAQTAQHKTSRQIVSIADHKLMLSATPINLRSEDLRSILRMIDPDLFDKESIFEEMQKENEPIVAAREVALDPATTPERLANALAMVASGSLLRNDHQLGLLREQMTRNHANLSPHARADIAQRLEDMSMLGAIVNRTRRRDVVAVQIKRRPACRRWTMAPLERQFYDAATEIIRRYALQNGLSDAFLLSNTQRVLASSLPAAWARWSLKDCDRDYEDEEDDDRPDTPVGPLVGALSTICRDRRTMDALESGDSKFSLLRRALAETWKAQSNEKVIIFSSFRGTLDYLHRRLEAEGVRIRKLHGNIKEDRTEVLDGFRRDEGPVILLTSEIGSEGLDLQFCRIVINYDLPWNPMRVEQRIGRIDRIGQTAPSVEVISLVCEGTIEDAIYRRLYERLNLIERTLGGFEPILGDLLHDLEKRLLDPSLSKEDIEREIERAAVSAETRKLQEERLEAEAPGLIAHGDAILKKIQSSHDNQGWITPEELYTYTRDVLQARFPLAQLDRAPTVEELYDLKLGAAAHHAFTEFLRRDTRNHPTGLRRADRLRVVFGRSGGEGRRAERLHPSHPFIRFLGQAMGSDAQVMRIRPAVWVASDGARLKRAVEPGDYGIVVQRWTTKGLQTEDRLVFGGADIGSGRSLDPVIAEDLALSSLSGSQQQMPPAERCQRVARDLHSMIVEGIMTPAHGDHVRAAEAHHYDQCETRRAIIHRKLEDHRQRSSERIARLREGGKKSAGLIAAEQKRFDRFEARMQGQLEELEVRADFSFSTPETLGVIVVRIH